MLLVASDAGDISFVTWLIHQGSVGCEMQKHGSHWPKTEKKMRCEPYFGLSPEADLETRR